MNHSKCDALANTVGTQKIRLDYQNVNLPGESETTRTDGGGRANECARKVKRTFCKMPLRGHLLSIVFALSRILAAVTKVRDGRFGHHRQSARTILRV